MKIRFSRKALSILLTTALLASLLLAALPAQLAHAASDTEHDSVKDVMRFMFSMRSFASSVFSSRSTSKSISSPKRLTSWPLSFSSFPMTTKSTPALPVLVMAPYAATADRRGKPWSMPVGGWLMPRSMTASYLKRAHAVLP